MTFYILAGGRSRRMGQDKALLRTNGQALIERVIEAIPSEYHDVRIVANSSSQYSFLGLPIVRDVIPDLGPMSGLHAGLLDSASPYAFFLACDLPLISKQIIKSILGRHGEQDILCIRSERGLEPLCAIYSKNCLPLIEEQIRQGDYSLHHLIDLMTSEFIEMLDEPRLLNVNTREDWDRFLDASGFTHNGEQQTK